MKEKIINKFNKLPSVLLLLIVVLTYGFVFMFKNIVFKIILLFIYSIIYGIVSSILSNRDTELSSLKLNLQLKERIEEFEKSRN